MTFRPLDILSTLSLLSHRTTARRLLEQGSINELIDPRLGNCYSAQEVYCMMQAASLCIKGDPHLRPRMSEIVIRKRREESTKMDQKISSAEFALVQTSQENGTLRSKIVQSPDKLQVRQIFIEDL
ncbi:hypothetical protein Tco_0237934 [Tanacetum coccineum]